MTATGDVGRKSLPDRKIHRGVPWQTEAAGRATTFSTGPNLIIGNAGNNLLSGLLGDDTLVGGAGDDTLDSGSDAYVDSLVGGAGNDLYIADAYSDVIVESADGGIDTLHSEIVVDALADNVENVVLIGGDSPHTATPATTRSPAPSETTTSSGLPAAIPWTGAKVAMSLTGAQAPTRSRAERVTIRSCGMRTMSNWMAGWAPIP